MIIQVVTESESCLLSLASQLNENENLPLEFLECVGGIRFALHHYTDWINDKYCRNATEDTSFNEQRDRLQSAIAQLCLQKSFNTETLGPRILLLKLLFRKCGESGLNFLCTNSFINWIIPQFHVSYIQ